MRCAINGTYLILDWSHVDALKARKDWLPFYWIEFLLEPLQAVGVLTLFAVPAWRARELSRPRGSVYQRSSIDNGASSLKRTASIVMSEDSGALPKTGLQTAGV